MRSRSQTLGHIWLLCLALAVSLGAHLLLLLLPHATTAALSSDTRSDQPPLQLSIITTPPGHTSSPAPATSNTQPHAEPPPPTNPRPKLTHKTLQKASPMVDLSPKPAPPTQSHFSPERPSLSVTKLLSQVTPSPTEEPAPPPPGRLVYGHTARGYLWHQYMDDWTNKIERIGSLNYPQEVRNQGLNGGPVLSVVINADGSLASLRVAVSSGNATLDAAAQKLVRAAAPFAPFPPALAAQAQSLEIRRKWHFTTGNDLQVQ